MSDENDNEVSNERKKFSIMNPQRYSGEQRFSIPFDHDSIFDRDVNRFYLQICRAPRPLHNFLTGSSYEGEWDILGMDGMGTYTFINGVVYYGEMRDGEFHGDGTLTYPMGQKVHGQWANGKLLSWTYEFKDGLEYDESWHYCQYPDRRFYQSIKNGLKPARRERLTNDPEPRQIPPGCYDAGDGFFDPNNKYIFSVHDHKKVLRIPLKAEAEWIVKNCRKAWDEPTGFKPELYPNWTTGRNTSTIKLLDAFIQKDEDLPMLFDDEPQKHVHISL